MIARLTTIFAVAALLAPTAPAGMSVEHDGDASLSRFETYSWKEGTRARRESAGAAIVAAVDAELASLGLRRVDVEPDLYVVYHALADAQSLAQLRDATYWEFVTGITTTDPYDLGAGTLVIDVVDAGTEKVVWRGAVTGAVSGPVDKLIRKLEKSVRKLFRRLPR